MAETTIYDSSPNCIKLNEFGKCKLYYSYATQTYILVRPNENGGEHAFTHISLIGQINYKFESFVPNKTASDACYIKCVLSFKLQVILNGVTKEIYCEYKSPTTIDRNLLSETLYYNIPKSAPIMTRDELINETKQKYDETGFSNTLRSIIVNGNPKRPEVDLLDNNNNVI